MFCFNWIIEPLNFLKLSICYIFYIVIVIVIVIVIGKKGGFILKCSIQLKKNFGDFNIYNFSVFNINNKIIYVAVY